MSSVKLSSLPGREEFFESQSFFLGQVSVAARVELPEDHVHQRPVVHDAEFFEERSSHLIKDISIELLQHLKLSDPYCTLSQIAHKADCTQECHLFIILKHPHLPPL